MGKVKNPLILQLEKDWEKYLNEWNENFQKRLKEEIGGENRLLYAFSLNDEEIEFLSHLRVTGTYLQGTSHFDNDQAFKIWAIYNNKKITIKGMYMAGDKDSTYEEERDDFYEITECTDNLLTLDTHLCSLFNSIELADQIGVLYGKGDYFQEKANDIYVDEAFSDNG